MFKYIKLAVGISFAILFTACTQDEIEPLFEEETDIRVNGLLESYKTTLINETGWKAIYQSDSLVGATTMFLQFNEDESVQVVSDIFKGEFDLPSTYRVGISQFPELVFESYTTFHALFENNGIGLNAEFEFLFEEVSDEQIVLISKTDIQNKSKLILTPAEEGLIESLMVVQEQEDKLSNEFINPNLFRNITVKNPSGEVIYEGILDYQSALRFGLIHSQIEENVDSVIDAPISFIEDGFQFVKPLIVENVSFKTFNYNNTNQSFISMVDGYEAAISFATFPSFIKDDVFSINQAGSGTNLLYRPISVGDNALLTSDPFREIINEVNTQLSALGSFVFEQFVFTTNPNEDGRNTSLRIGITRTSDGGYFEGSYDFSASINDRKLVLNYQGITEPDTVGNNAFLESYFTALLDFFRNSEGLIYEEGAQYTTDNNTFPNNSGLLINSSASDERVYGVWIP